MKKGFKNALAVSMIALSLGLASCGKVSQKYADKINDAFANDKPLTKEQVEKALGDDGVFAGLGDSGAETWTVKKGNKTMNITVTFLGGKATAAVYTEVEKDDKK